MTPWPILTGYGIASARGSRYEKHEKTPRPITVGGSKTGSDLSLLLGGRGRFRTADICFVRAALYP